MDRRVRGKRSATTFVDGTSAATSMSCNSDKGRSAVASKECGGTADRDARGGVISALPLRAVSAELELCQTPPNVSRWLVSVATRCVLSGRAVGIPSKPRRPARPPGFRTDPLPQPDKLRFAHDDHHRPSASCGHCYPASFENCLRPMMTVRHSMSGKARNNTGRDARYKNTDVTRPPQRP